VTGSALIIGGRLPRRGINEVG